MLSLHAFPNVRSQLATATVNVFLNPSFDPLAFIVCPDATQAIAINVAQLQPRSPAAFPGIDDILQDLAKIPSSQQFGAYGLEPRAAPTESLGGWCLSAEIEGEERLLACNLGCDGKVLVGVGSCGTIWIWVAQKKHIVN
jgi:hypothetical protein